jgi:hypothetical protein
MRPSDPLLKPSALMTSTTIPVEHTPSAGAMMPPSRPAPAGQDLRPMLSTPPAARHAQPSPLTQPSPLSALPHKAPDPYPKMATTLHGGRRVALAHPGSREPIIFASALKSAPSTRPTPSLCQGDHPNARKRTRQPA